MVSWNSESAVALAAEWRREGILDADRTLKAYEMLRPVLPQNIAKKRQDADRLSDVLDACDALILDGFGVINVGTEKIDGIDALLAEAVRRDITVVVLTNGASHPSANSAAKYQRWGLDLSPHQIVSSRDACIAQIKEQAAGLRLITACSSTTPLGLASEMRVGEAGDTAWAAADGLVLLGTTSWTESDQAKLEQFLHLPDKHLFIANPDISAPHHDGFSLEPGFWALQAMQHTPIIPHWAGKPHAPAFELAVARAEALAGRPIPRHRMLMVGDSPHTDILGGNAAGLSTALISSYGLLRDHDAPALLEELDIQPDFLVRTL